MFMATKVNTKILIEESRISRKCRISRKGMEEKYISGYRNLVLWQEAKNLTVLVYDLTRKFPKSEEFGLTSQMRRASVSVMSQIAEGWLRKSVRDKLRFLEISEGSLLELENQGVIASEVGYIKDDDYKKFDLQRGRVSYLLYKYKLKIKI